MVNIFDLLPDEIGEWIGCGLIGSASCLYIDHVKSGRKTEKSKAQEMKVKMEELSKRFNSSCLSPEAINYLKNHKKEEL
jgi:hypothetical protein